MGINTYLPCLLLQTVKDYGENVIISEGPIESPWVFIGSGGNRVGQGLREWIQLLAVFKNFNKKLAFFNILQLGEMLGVHFL